MSSDSLEWVVPSKVRFIESIWAKGKGAGCVNKAVKTRVGGLTVQEKRILKGKAAMFFSGRWQRGIVGKGLRDVLFTV